MKRGRDNPKSRAQRERNGAPEAVSGTVAVLSRRRLWLFRALALVLPVLALGAMEAALRLGGYGYPTAFFKKFRIGNEEFLVNNDQVGLRFFPPELVRLPPPVRMHARKPAGTCRIFILGESAAMGDPEPAFGAGRYLGVLLRERFPGAQFEVVNAAMTAINSHAILPIARECARHDGDLWIICMGNNEMVGPFGAATVFGPRAPPRALVRLSLATQKTRVGQLIMAWGRKLGGSSSRASWGGMQMFLQNRIAPDDPHKERVYRSFEQNLRDMVRAGLDSGAAIVLSTVAVNLKDSPPFASMSNSNLPAADLSQFAKLYAEGLQLQEQRRFAEAAQRFEEATGIDARFAEAQFRWGDCLLQLANAAAARRHFQQACDSDALAFRADSRINGLIRQVGQQFAGRRLALCDAVAALETSSAVGICGTESFYEHVHLNFDGNYRLARAWAEQVANFLPAQVRRQAAADWASQAACERWLGLTDWNRASVLDEMIRRLGRPPLSSQFNNPPRLAALHRQVRAWRDPMNAPAAAQAREVYLEGIQRAPADFYLHQNFADFLVALHDWKQAVVEWQQVRELIPHDYLAYFRLGWLEAQQGNLAGARSYSLQAAALHPGFSDVWLQLGDIHATEEKLELALEDYNRARAVSPQNGQVRHQLGKLLWRMNREVEAIENLREAVRLRPDHWEFHFTLGGALGLDENIAEAKKEFEEVIRLKPDHALAHLNLGVALMKQDRLEEALGRFEEALRLDPANQVAQDYLGQVQGMRNTRR